LVGFILDTKVFNAVVDGELELSAFRGRTVYVAHTQLDELENTPNLERRRALLEVFKSIDAQELPTASMVWGVSRWSKSSWSEGDLFRKLHDAVCAADASRKKKVGAENQIRDALLGETAIHRDVFLVTDDSGLREAVLAYGGKVVSLAEFCADGIGH
jgi:hypothetical protein